MSWKKRTKQEIEEIIKDSSMGMSAYEVCAKHNLCEDSLYRILQKYRGLNADAIRRDHVKSKVEKLEKRVRQQEEEIALLRAAFKKHSGRK